MRYAFLCFCFLFCCLPVHADFLCGSQWGWGTFYIENNLKDTNWSIVLYEGHYDSTIVTFPIFKYIESHGGVPSNCRITAIHKPDGLRSNDIGFWTSGEDIAIRLDSILVSPDSVSIQFTELKSSQLSFLKEVQNCRLKDKFREKLNIGIFFGVVALIFVLIVIRSSRLR